MPFDFSNVQMSAWFSLLPATFYIWMNMKVLKMDHMEEYTYFKRESGLKILAFSQYSSYLFFAVYMSVVVTNYQVFLMESSKQVWQNFEGIFIYTLMACLTTSLSLYSRSKLTDFEDAIALKLVASRKKNN
mmetsp:Transcript_14314/g.24355  ORF Transcript_14314/g.24355 Transcript_14314/m.24355 type:complete len:131 (+) Transcript_14314:447-839(+)